MAWAVVVQDLKTGSVELIDREDARPDLRDLAADIHILPLSNTSERGDWGFGAHDFSRRCYCVPKLRPHSEIQTFVVHRNIVN